MWEARIARAFVATPATIVRTDVPGLTAGKVDYFYPAISYSYIVAGKTRTSSSIWPYPHTTDRDESKKLLRDFPAGVMTVAYVDPANADEVYLLREYSSKPFWAAAGAVIALSVGIGGMIGIIGAGRKKMQTLPADHPHWITLLPIKRQIERWREAIYLLITAALPVAILAVFLARLERPMDWAAECFVLSCAVIFIGAIWLVIRTWNIGRSHSDVRLLLSSAPLLRGQPFTLRAQIDAYRPLDLTEFSATLICTKCDLKHYGRRTMMAKTIVGRQILHLTDRAVTTPPGKMLAGAAEAKLDPEKWPKSGPEGLTTYPYNVWEIQVTLAGSPDFFETFPVEVV